MNLIVNVDQNWAIGQENHLINFIEEDMRFFRQTTLNKTVVMGRNTLASFPKGAPLKNRQNLILTSHPETLPEGCVGFKDMESLLSYLSTLPTEDIWIIGGEQIYRLFLPYCQWAKVTKVENQLKGADAFFPNLDLLPEWVLTDATPLEEDSHNLEYSFCTYENLSPASYS